MITYKDIATAATGVVISSNGIPTAATGIVISSNGIATAATGVVISSNDIAMGDKSLLHLTRIFQHHMSYCRN